LNEITSISPIQGKWYLLCPSQRPTQQSFRDRLVDFVLRTQHCSEHSEASHEDHEFNLQLGFIDHQCTGQFKKKKKSKKTAIII
jgi:hypothetical protein